MDRRTSLSAAIALALAALAPVSSAEARTAGGIKLTVLYGRPKSENEFEKYYFSTHMPIVVAASQGIRLETARGLPGQDGSAPAYYRIFEAWFESAAQMAAITGTPAWARAAEDVPNYASGGFSVFVSAVD
ncbi:MAG: EthD family reductase [Gemmatimonadaceae bacterium]|nr:EthD family reductase [Gemmatimonadaceae bacterium]